MSSFCFCCADWPPRFQSHDQYCCGGSDRMIELDVCGTARVRVTYDSKSYKKLLRWSDFELWLTIFCVPRWRCPSASSTCNKHPVFPLFENSMMVCAEESIAFHVLSHNRAGQVSPNFKRVRTFDRDSDVSHVKTGSGHLELQTSQSS